MNLHDARENYDKDVLHKQDLNSDPFIQFKSWYELALGSQIKEPNAMTLATATCDGIPSARIVLLKEIREDGFVFYTNYTSHKGKELASNPNVALVFLWKSLEKQIRINGHVEHLSIEESESYFKKRPIKSQIGAWASPQSGKIKSRAFLEEKFEHYKSKFETVPMSKPPHWGGYKVIPQTFEFWQGRRSRLHDRFVYQRNDTNWDISRVAP